MPTEISFTYYLPPDNHITGKANVEFDVTATMWEDGRVDIKCSENYRKALNAEVLTRQLIIQAREEIKYINRQQTANLKAVEKILKPKDEPGSQGQNIYLIFLILSLSFLI